MKTTVYLLASCLLFPWATAESQAKRVDLIKDESKVTYQISHPLHEIEASSKEVVYRLDIDPGKKEVRSVSAQVDVTTFDSGNSNRDSHAMEVIDALTYPDVTFTSTSVIQNGDSVRVAGKLTFHGVTKDIVILAAAKWSPNRLDVHGDFDVSLTEFKIERPSLLMIPVSDTLKFIIVAAYRWN
jgi:polyisoprenoid-binding protein YceI